MGFPVPDWFHNNTASTKQKQYAVLNLSFSFFYLYHPIPIKFTSFIVSTLAVGQGLAADFNLHATYTDELVNVGNLDSFWSVWNHMYDVSDNNGGLSDHTTWQYNGNCNTKVSGWQMRDALIHAMWATVQAAGQQNQYPVYTDCSGLTWQESTPRNPNAACDRATTKKIFCPCEYMVECQQFSWGRKLPSQVRINVYNKDGSLRADMYQIKIGAQTLRGESGCGKAGAIAEVLASFVPGVGQYFDKGCGRTQLDLAVPVLSGAALVYMADVMSPLFK
ncbi:hypothetical protein FAGAP_11022 [Fusarium agapanthi]|uniref:Uncharacterized protein n=1 Tax=Fusarium agapanthi TaxID=1803897 RepID=A0A9P5AZU4_9HYPO|nr:hypothetical protein FAGAP_11022 [Fusarium agapanthi]